jgi:hypothetical protein
MLGGTANATATATGGVAPSFSAGANATSTALTINGNAAQAKSTATGAAGFAEASALTNFGNFTFVNAESSSPLNRDSPDESPTGINVRAFPALLQDRRDVLTATSTSGNPNAGRGSDLAIFLAFGRTPSVGCS